MSPITAGEIEMAESDVEIIPKKFLTLIFAFTAALGIAFYFSWSIMYGTWFDLGVYTITIVLVGFGVIGFLLYSMED